MTSAAPPMTHPVSRTRGGDFPDWLSPMLVKELRQGMRSPVFVWGLIATHVALAIICWLQMEQGFDRDLNSAFWAVVCGILCGLLPLRGTNALYEEVNGGTVDTLILTRLTGTRIAAGKWIAIVAQQGLVALSILPYVMVRYFSGGLNVAMELAWLGIFLVLGVCAAGVLTGVSWLKHFLLRSAVMLGVLGLVGAFCAVTVDEELSRARYVLDSMYRDLGGWGMALFPVAAVHLCFIALDIGAGRLGVITENRAVLRRLLSTAVCAFYGAVAFSGISGSVAARAWLGVLFLCATGLLTVIQALCETPVNLAPVLRPFASRGWAGRLLGRFLYPGWASGLCWAAVLLAVAGSLTIWFLRSVSAGGTFGFDWVHSAWVVGCFGAGVVGVLPVPLVLNRLARREKSWHFGWYLLFLGMAGLWQLAFIVACAATKKAAFLLPGFLFPTMGSAGFEWQSPAYRRWNSPAQTVRDPDRYLEWTDEQFAIAVGAGLVFWWALALLLTIPAFRQTRVAERELAE